MVVRLSDPTFTIHEEDIDGDLKEGFFVEVRGKTWKIRELNPLGHGRIELRLINGKS